MDSVCPGLLQHVPYCFAIATAKVWRIADGIETEIHVDLGGIQTERSLISLGGQKEVKYKFNSIYKEEE